MVHSSRHSLRDGLRAIKCPFDVIDPIGGWSTFVWEAAMATATRLGCWAVECYGLGDLTIVSRQRTRGIRKHPIPPSLKATGRICGYVMLQSPLPNV